MQKSKYKSQNEEKNAAPARRIAKLFTLHFNFCILTFDFYRKDHSECS